MSFYILSTEAQSQVMDFIAFWRQKYAVVELVTESPDVDLLNGNFIGMWCIGLARRRHRQDLADSTA